MSLFGQTLIVDGGQVLPESPDALARMQATGGRQRARRERLTRAVSRYEGIAGMEWGCLGWPMSRVRILDSRLWMTAQALELLVRQAAGNAEPPRRLLCLFSKREARGAGPLVLNLESGIWNLDNPRAATPP